MRRNLKNNDLILRNNTDVYYIIFKILIAITYNLLAFKFGNGSCSNGYSITS